MQQVTDAAVRKLLGDLADAERKHHRTAGSLEQKILTPQAREGEDTAGRRLFLLQVIQPGLAGLMDGSVSTLAPVFAAAFATKSSWDAFLVGMAASVGAGISMGFAEALSDDGSLTGRGKPLIRGPVCGLMTAAGGVGHTLPFLISRLPRGHDRGAVRGGCRVGRDQLHSPPLHGHAAAFGRFASGRGRRAGVCRRNPDRQFLTLGLVQSLSMRCLYLALGATALFAQDSRNTYIPNTDTHITMPVYKTRAEWEARKVHLRKQILSAAGLLPLPPKTPLHPQIFGRMEREGYAIEKVLIETMPGYYLGGNLYSPLGKSGKLPGILTAHGHWTYGRLEPSTLGSVPARCINLARQGYVVFAYDMVGYNDTIQTPHEFGLTPVQNLWSFGPLGLQLWNSMRALDFLQSRDNVDPARIAMTGESGGGTQTFLADGGRRAHQMVRAGEYDLGVFPWRLALREYARPARGHVQSGNRGHDGASADAHGFGHRRLDAQHAARRISRHAAHV